LADFFLFSPSSATQHEREVLTMISTMADDTATTTAVSSDTITSVTDYTGDDNVVQLERKRGKGFLLTNAKSGGMKRLIPSEAAKIVPFFLRMKLAWDTETCCWMWWEKTHWDIHLTGAKAAHEIDLVVDDGMFPVGYTPRILKEIIDTIKTKEFLPLPPLVEGKIPFINGLLDPDNKTLVRSTPMNGMSWCLPYRYDESAGCPEIISWLKRCVGENPGTVNLLLCWLAALVRGIHLQYFVMLIGAGGSGKGTFQRLAMAMVGEQNYVSTSLNDLENDKFEPARIVGKRLCLVNEAGRHGGAVNALKALIGGDTMKIERKHVQSSGNFVFSGLVLMASNEQLQTTDSTSGIERRRVTIRFPVAASSDERWNWRERGGESMVLHTEIPGLINKLLKIPVAKIHEAFEVLPESVMEENLEAMVTSNSVADWMTSRTLPALKVWCQTGTINKIRDPISGLMRCEFEWTRLYPNYISWCESNGRTRPVSIRKFSSTVVDIAVKLGHRVYASRDQRGTGLGIHGIALLTRDESEYKSHDARRLWMKLGPKELEKRCPYDEHP
jgi:putative DNA primase/helicase